MHSFLINEVTDAKRLKDLPAWLNRKVADLSPKGESPTIKSRVSLPPIFLRLVNTGRFSVVCCGASMMRI